MSRILIVEDSPAQALAIRLLLEQEGSQVFWAADGRAGIQMARRCEPDAIVLDIEMPEMDGFEVCECLRADTQTADIPVVMLTVLNEPETLVKTMGLGAIDFIPKDPFSGHVLVETLRQLHVLESNGGTGIGAAGYG